jgi:hypothetical protein
MAGAVTSNAEPLVVLAALTDSEKAEVLDSLIAQDPALAARAEREGRGVLAAVEIDAVASAVADALLGLDQEELSQHAGRTRHGYVEPTTAAWALLEAALEPWLDDITRRAGLVLPAVNSVWVEGVITRAANLVVDVGSKRSGDHSRGVRAQRA